MKIAYQLDKDSFGKYAEEFFSNRYKYIYFIWGFVLALFLYFLLIGILVDNEAFGYAFGCIIFLLFAIVFHICYKRSYVTQAINNFFDKYKDNTVSYTLEFKEDYFEMQDNINDDKTTTYDREVKKVVVTKSAVALVINSNVIFINNEKLTEYDINFIKDRYSKNRNKKSR